MVDASSGIYSVFTFDFYVKNHYLYISLKCKGIGVSKLSSKRQITLPVEHCTELGIEPGDDLEFFVANGQLTAVKKYSGAAKGVLKGLNADKSMTDEESRQSAIRR